MKKNRIESKFKIGDNVVYIAKGSLYEHMWFEIINRRMLRNGTFEYRVTDKIITFWAREKDLILNEYYLRGENLWKEYF